MVNGMLSERKLGQEKPIQVHLTTGETPHGKCFRLSKYSRWVDVWCREGGAPSFDIILFGMARTMDELCNTRSNRTTNVYEMV